MDKNLIYIYNNSTFKKMYQLDFPNFTLFERARNLKINRSIGKEADIATIDQSTLRFRVFYRI